MVKLHSSPIVVHKTSTAVQKIMGVPTSAVLFCQRLGTEVAIRLGLVQCHNALFTTSKPRTMLTQFVFNLSLRQNKSGGRFFALRLVDGFNLLGFGRNVGIEETQL